MMSDAVLVLNAGSSSIKFGLFHISGTEPYLLCKGLLDETEAKPGLTVTDVDFGHQAFSLSFTKSYRVFWHCGP